MIASFQYVSDILAREGLRPNRNLGQNFFINGTYLNELIHNIPLEGKRVLEIGPGLGGLTEILLNRGATVIAVEKDPNMIRLLNAALSSLALTIYEGDCLKFQTNCIKRPFTVAGNLPYCITADILEKLFLIQPEQMVLMLQKEAADRFYAKPHDKNYMPLGAAYSLFYSVERLGDISPENYLPPPSVTSTMIYLKRKDIPLTEDPKALLGFFSECFHLRRKTLVNNLSNYKNVKRIILDLGFSASIRGEALSPEQLLLLYKSIHLDRSI